MAAQEMNAELHVGTVITKTFGTRGSFLGQAVANTSSSTPLRNIRRQLYTGADATLMEAALNLCEWKLKHNIKTAAFERLAKLLKKHVLPKDGSELTETWYQM
eukprot:jgi/Tetstr1/426970/TSEL_017183.t1